MEKSKTTPDRKHDQLVLGQDNMLHGQSTMTDHLESMAGQLSHIQNTLDDRLEDKAGAALKESVPVQETDSDKKKQSPERKKETATNQGRKFTKLSKEMPVKDLWVKQGFRDEFCKQMNVRYHKTNAKHWPYLGEEFGIKGDKIDEFASFDDASPSESMFLTMERTMPYLKTEELCDALKKAKAFKVLRIVENAIQAKKITPSDLVSDMWNKAPEAFEQVILNLDKRGVWRDVAKSLNFEKRDCQSFERDMDPTLNPTRDLFDVLRTQRPRLKVKDFEEKLKQIGQGGVLKILADDCNISGDRDMLLRKLSEIPNIMFEIEHILNDPKDTSLSLWQLAESFKRDGVEIDVELFRHRGTDANPTYHLMEYVIARFPEEQTIQNLIKHLLNIGRRDCLGTIAEYLEGGAQEIEKLCQEMEKLRVKPKEASEQDD